MKDKPTSENKYIKLAKGSTIRVVIYNNMQYRFNHNIRRFIDSIKGSTYFTQVIGNLTSSIVDSLTPVSAELYEISSFCIVSYSNFTNPIRLLNYLLYETDKLDNFSCRELKMLKANLDKCIEGYNHA